MKQNGAEQPQETSSCGAGAGAGQEQVQVRSGMRNACGSAVARDALRDLLDPTEGWSEDSAMDRKT